MSGTRRMINGGSTPLSRTEFPVITRVMIYFYFFLTFFEPYINGIIGSVTKYYIFLMIGVILLTAKKISFKGYHINYVVWLLYLFLSLLWTLDYTIFKQSVLSQIGMVALFCVLTAVPLSGKVIDNITKTLWLGSAAIGILSLFFSQPYKEDYENRMVLTILGQQNDPNNQAAFVIVGIIISIYFLAVERKYKFISIIIAAINFYSLMLTGSRGGVVAIIFVLSCFVFLRAKKDSRVRGFKKFVIVLAIGVFVFIIAIKFLPEDIFARLFEIDSYDSGSKRDVLWSNTLQLCSQKLNFVFGSGWGAYYGYNDHYSAVHNTYLAMLSDVGIIGVYLFFAPILSKLLYLLRKQDVLPICFLLGGLVPSFFLDAINKRFFWNAVMLFFIIYNFHSNSEKKR